MNNRNTSLAACEFSFLVMVACVLGCVVQPPLPTPGPDVTPTPILQGDAAVYAQCAADYRKRCGDAFGELAAELAAARANGTPLTDAQFLKSIEARTKDARLQAHQPFRERMDAVLTPWDDVRAEKFMLESQKGAYAK